MKKRKSTKSSTPAPEEEKKGPPYRNIEEAKKLIDEFLKSNHLDEMSVTEDDLEALLAGGKDSKLVKLSQELDANQIKHKERSRRRWLGT